MVEDLKKIMKEIKKLKKDKTKKEKTKWNKPIVVKSILKKERPTLTIQKPKSNPYVNRFFDDEWADD